ncbi:hypothetical protein ACHAWT_001565 [Skeletonema menzelii]
MQVLFFIITILAALINLRVVHSLSCLQSTNRRQFLAGGCSSLGSACVIISTTAGCPAVAVDDRDDEDISSLLDAKTMDWNGPSWTAARYRSSTLKQSSSNYAPPASNNPVFYPTWMEGYHTISYRFKSASFPQGRKILTLRTPGAGLGSCLMLPNIGYNPSTFPIHFIRNSNAQVYEDLTYNVPRIFEAFWTQAKVLGVQTNQIIDIDGLSNDLTTKCLVTGEGCIAPNARPPSTRVAIDFNGPTRGGGRVTQSSDVTILDSSVQDNVANTYYATKTFSQYNVNQDLQLFYKEVTSLRRKENDSIDGKVRIAAFLPKYIRGMDVSSNSDGDSYDDNEAVAIYDYNIFLQRIDETEAATL